MTLSDQSISELVKGLQLVILAMKCLCKFIMAFPQSLDIIDGALAHIARAE